MVYFVNFQKDGVEYSRLFELKVSINEFSRRMNNVEHNTTSKRNIK